MPYQIAPIFLSTAVSYNVALEDETGPEVLDVVFHGSGGRDVSASFGYDVQDGVEIRTLEFRLERAPAGGQCRISFSAGIQEVLVKERYFDSGNGKILSEVADLRVIFSNGSWLRIEPGHEVSDLIKLSQSG